MGHQILLAIVLRTWTLLHATPDAQIAEAMASEVDAQPVFDRDLLVSAIAVYAALESGIRMHPEAQSWDAKAGVSCGLLQEPCAFVHVHPSVREQIRYWLHIVVGHGLLAVDGDAARVRRRLAIAMRAVGAE